jgi:hypothetical protein
VRSQWTVPEAKSKRLSDKIKIMADETPRLNLDTYEQGDENWGHTDTVEAVDEHAIERGPIVKRPDQGSYDDELYHATDQNITWRWDADADDWVAAGGLGSKDKPVPGTTHLETANIESLNNVFYASNFDGSDGGAKIQNALNKANSEPGENGVIVGPEGPDSPSSAPESDVWAVSTTIDITDYDNTQLLGWGYPLLYLADGAEDDILRAGEDTGSNITENVRIEGFRLHGNKANNGTGGKKDPDGDTNTEFKGNSGIRPIRCADWKIIDCHFQNFQRFGYCEKLTQGPMTVQYSTADNCDDDGFTVTNQYSNTQSPDSAKTVLENVEGTNNFDQGIEIEDGAKNVVVRDSRFANNGDGATVKSHGSGTASDEQPCENVSFEGCDFVNNTNTGVFFQGAPTGKSKDYTVDESCYFSGNGGYAVRIASDTSNAHKAVRGVTVEGHYVLDGESAAIGHGGDRIEDISVDVTVEVVDGANANSGIEFLAGDYHDLTITAQIDGGGFSGHGIFLKANKREGSGAVVSDDTVVRNCGLSGLAIRPANNTIQGITIRGTYFNNGQDTNAANSERVGVRLQDPNDLLSDISMVGVVAYDDQSTQTQQYGSYTNAPDMLIEGCAVDDNAQGGHFVAPGGLSVREGRGFNSGDPSSTGDWNGETTRAERHNAVIEDTSNNTLYMAQNGSWVAIDTQ